MEHRAKAKYIHVKGNQNVLERSELRKLFGKFGDIHKLYVNTDKNYANIYYKEPQSIIEAIEACSKLNTQHGLTVSPSFTKKPKKNLNQSEINESNSIASSNSPGTMEMDMLKGDLVDVYGRLVVYLKADNGDIFVDLKDFERAGFKLFKKTDFDNMRHLEKDIQMDIEAKMLHFGIKCALEANHVFTEKEIINSFKKVKAQLFGDRITNDAKAELRRDRRSNSQTRSGSSNDCFRYQNQKSHSDYRGRSSEIMRPLERVSLEKGSFELKITYLLSDKPVFYAQKLVNAHILVKDILVRLNSGDLPPVIEKPLKDMLVVVQFKEIWYRAVIVRERDLSGSVIVELLDYGNREEIKGEIRQMSEELQKIPAQAIRCTVCVNSTLDISKLEIDQEIEVVVSKTFENREATTYLVDVKQIFGSDKEVGTSLSEKQSLEDVKPRPEAAAKCFMQIPKPTAKIVPGETIFIVNHTEDKLIVKNKEMASLSKEIITKVAAMQKEPVTDPKVGQYVLCNSFDYGDGFFRAIIENIHGKLATLKLIDFCIEETLPLASLKNIDEDLASLPPAHIEINYPPLKKVTDEGLIMLDELIRVKSKIKSTEVNGQIDFLIDGELLSKKIIPKLRPPREPITVAKIVETAKAESPEGKNRIFYEDMPFQEPKAGVNLYACYAYHGASLNIIDVAPENLELLDKVILNHPEDNEPYKPVQLEMCLAKYFDGTWCRAVATGNEGDKILVKYVDLGNIAKVAKEDIRKLPEELKSIAILGIDAQIEGIEISDVVEKRLKQVISDGEVLDVDVKKGSVNWTYSVELPAIYDLLKNEGLIS